MADTKTGEPMIVSICRDPFAATFNGQRGQEGVRDKVALDVCDLAQAAEDFPVAWTRANDGAGWLVAQLFHECQGFVHSGGRIEHAGMGDNAKKPAQGKIGQAEGVVRIDEVLKPVEISEMVW